MRRTKTMLASTALGLSLVLSACGGGDESSDSGASQSSESSESSESPESDGSAETAAYCEDLRSAEGQFNSFEQGDAAQFEEAIATFRSLGEEAPEEVAADWDTFLAGFDQLEAALTKAGIDFSDLPAINQGQIPKGADPQALQQLGAEIQSLSSPELEQASNSIEEHASSECDIQLGQ